MKQRIYLDWNATAPMGERVKRSMVDALDRHGNPSSVHAEGRAARGFVESARDKISAHIGAPPGNLVFTGGGTEANNLALLGLASRKILVSAIEHDSVLEAAKASGRLAGTIPVDQNGVVQLDELRNLIAGYDGEILVSIMAANNETGVIQPISEIADIVHEQGGVFHVDAIQAISRIPFDMNTLSVDLTTISSHKIGGPMGVGALAFRAGIALDGVIVGGGQELGMRAGSENLPGVAGFSAAVTDSVDEPVDWDRVATLRDRLEDEIRQISPDTVIMGADSTRLPNTSCILTPGLKGETQVMAMDLAGIAISSGSACSSGKVGPSHVLAAMGYDVDLAGCAIRVSLTPMTTDADIDHFLKSWKSLFDRTQSAARAAE